MVRLRKRARFALPAIGRPKSRSRSVRAAALALVLVVGGSTGCTMVENFSQSMRYDESFNNTAAKYRNRSMSSRNWHRHKNRYCNEASLSDFCAGYRQGYEDVASGTSNGCTPNFPPRSYWGWQHQSAQGQQQVASWFSGYPHGARAAEEEGVGNWSQIQMSSTLQAQFVTAGKMPNQGHAVYPISDIHNSTAGRPTPAGAPLSAGPVSASGEIGLLEGVPTIENLPVVPIDARTPVPMTANAWPAQIPTAR